MKGAVGEEETGTIIAGIDDMTDPDPDPDPDPEGIDHDRERRRATESELAIDDLNQDPCQDIDQGKQQLSVILLTKSNMSV